MMRQFGQMSCPIPELRLQEKLNAAEKPGSADNHIFGWNITPRDIRWETCLPLIRLQELVSKSKSLSSLSLPYDIQQDGSIDLPISIPGLPHLYHRAAISGAILRNKSSMVAKTCRGGALKRDGDLDRLASSDFRLRLEPFLEGLNEVSVEQLQHFLMNGKTFNTRLRLFVGMHMRTLFGWNYNKRKKLYTRGSGTKVLPHAPIKTKTWKTTRDGTTITSYIVDYKGRHNGKETLRDERHEEREVESLGLGQTPRAEARTGSRPRREGSQGPDGAAQPPAGVAASGRPQELAASFILGRPRPTNDRPGCGTGLSGQGPGDCGGDGQNPISATPRMDNHQIGQSQSHGGPAIRGLEAVGSNQVPAPMPLRMQADSPPTQRQDQDPIHQGTQRSFIVEVAPRRKTLGPNASVDDRLKAIQGLIKK